MTSTNGPLADAVIRARPEDFLVEEVTAFEPTGQGEHLALLVQKRGLDHASMVRHLARAFRVPPGRVGWAGMKDKEAVTQQWVTVQTEASDVPDLGHESLAVVSAERHARRLRLGHLTGNRFTIRMRQVDPTAVVEANRRLTTLASSGLPNRFMSQRFGYRGVNAVIGEHVLRRSPSQALAVWLGTAGACWPEAEQRRREDFDAGDFGAALDAWPRNWKPERAALASLKAGDDPEAVLSRVDRRVRRIWTDAAQSAIFNEVLRTRTGCGAMDGDITWSHDRFLEAMEVPTAPPVPTGPMWGRSMRRAGGEAAALELAALRKAGLTEEMMTAPSAPQGARRPLAIPVVSPRCVAGFDDHGPFVELGFVLPKGGYATAVAEAIISGT
ncbi:MAG: tRNA pseudouridine(13) synthase TruD [Phycisphaerales bacterium]|nr:tRNA pseudouridine(13) synthase TruD [Phycisphaerales bacterium]